jgi:histone H3/H4
MAKQKQAKTMEMLLIGSKVKAALRDQGVNVGDGTIEALNGMIHWYVTQAALRTKANGRKTTRPHDVVLMEAYDR